MLKLLTETKLTVTESLSFSFLFFHLVKILYAKCKFLPSKRKKHFLWKLKPFNTRKIKIVNFKRRLWQFRRKIFKNQCFSGYIDMLMAYIDFPVHVHTHEFLKGTGFCNCYQFWIDAIMVGSRMRKLFTDNENLVFSFKLQKQIIH